MFPRRDRRGRTLLKGWQTRPAGVRVHGGDPMFISWAVRSYQSNGAGCDFSQGISVCLIEILYPIQLSNLLASPPSSSFDPVVPLRLHPPPRPICSNFFLQFFPPTPFRFARRSRGRNRESREGTELFSDLISLDANRYCVSSITSRYEKRVVHPRTSNNCLSQLPTPVKNDGKVNALASALSNPL